ncbi:MAG: hypothetical protein CMJ58_15105 [Planctomycetaceae bacterium]|nr:hypothetical protein [Planctomycetaceae bacterium]
MEIPPLEPFDIDHLEPVTVEVTLRLPRLTDADSRAAAQQFSGVLAAAGSWNIYEQPAELASFLSHCLLAVADELLEDPRSLLSLFCGPQYEPWFERRCDLLAPSGAGAALNRAAIANTLDRWKIDDANQHLLKSAAIVMAIASLATIGRLPLQEQPDLQAMN